MNAGWPGDADLRDTSTPPSQLTLPSVPSLGTPVTTRKVAVIPVNGVDEIGVVDNHGNVVSKLWSDPVTEVVRSGQTEDWEIYNTYGNQAHPIHLHLVEFQVLNRQPFTGQNPVQVTGSPMAPESWETGSKDTVVCYSRQVTRIRAKFDRPGRDVWHCHIIRHEDNDAVRRLRSLVVAESAGAVVIIAIAAVLVQTTPARSPAASAPPPTVQSVVLAAPSRLFTLTVDDTPARVGPTRSRCT